MNQVLTLLAVVTFAVSLAHFHAAFRGKYIGRLRIAGVRDRNLGLAETRHRIGAAAFGLLGLAVGLTLFYLGRQ
jgi:hypothetical protein